MQNKTAKAMPPPYKVFICFYQIYTPEARRNFKQNRTLMPKRRVSRHSTGESYATALQGVYIFLSNFGGSYRNPTPTTLFLVLSNFYAEVLRVEALDRRKLRLRPTRCLYIFIKLWRVV